MPLSPKTPIDLLLAPVAAEIDLNLQSLRDETVKEIDYLLQLELNRAPASDTAAARAAQVREAALRNVELHGWQAEVTDDLSRLRLSGGSVSIELGLSANLIDYILHGTA